MIKLNLVHLWGTILQIRYTINVYPFGTKDHPSGSRSSCAASSRRCLFESKKSGVDLAAPLLHHVIPPKKKDGEVYTNRFSIPSEWLVRPTCMINQVNPFRRSVLRLTILADLKLLGWPVKLPRDLEMKKSRWMITIGSLNYNPPFHLTYVYIPFSVVVLDVRTHIFWDLLFGTNTKMTIHIT